MNLKARSTSRSQSPKSNSRFLKRINRIPSQSNSPWKSPWKSLKRWTTGTTWRMRMKMTTKKKLRRQASTPPNTPIRNKSKRLFWSCLRKKRRQLLKINNKTRWLQHQTSNQRQLKTKTAMTQMNLLALIRRESHFNFESECAGVGFAWVLLTMHTHANQLV